MGIDRKLIEHLERLARIELAEDEKQRLAQDLARIVQFVETVQSVDTSGVDEFSPEDQADADRVRADTAVPGLEHARAIDQAPDETDGCFRVPPVIDRGDGG